MYKDKKANAEYLVYDLKAHELVVAAMKNHPSNDGARTLGKRFLFIVYL